MKKLILSALLISLMACGQNGKDGLPGTDGQNGSDGANGTNGTNGKNGKDGSNGANGIDGKDGKDGLNGQDGVSPTLQVVVTQSITCSNGGTQVVLLTNGVPQAFEICNGEVGQTGPQGASGVPLDIEIIDPCGDAAGIYDEVLLRLPDKTLIASFSANANGQNTRLSVLTQGNYITTDGSNCRFSVDANGNIN